MILDVVVNGADAFEIASARGFEMGPSRSRSRPQLWAFMAASIVTFSSVRAEAQQAPEAQNSTPDVESAGYPKNLPGLARVPGEAAALRAQSAKVRDAVFAEVTQAVLAMRTADSSIERSSAQARAAEEAYSARRDLFRFGKGASVELADAEANLFQARLASVSARIDQ